MIQEHVEPAQIRLTDGEGQTDADADFARPPDRMTWLSLASPPVHSEITAAFAEALAEAAKLPVEDQNYLAHLIMEDIAEEKKWADSFARSQDMLGRMAAQARQEIAEGKVYPLEDIL